jgi:hypothetical protein
MPPDVPFPDRIQKALRLLTKGSFWQTLVLNEKGYGDTDSIGYHLIRQEWLYN